MFKRSAAYLNLSPAERAFLRLVEGLMLSALITGLQAVMPLLNAGVDATAIPWSSVAHTFIATVLGAIGAAVVKYAKAQGDPALPPANPPALPAAPVAPPVPAVPTVPPIVGAVQA